MQLTEARRHYWQRNLRITGVLLAIWFAVTFVVSYYAHELDFTFFGWPFSFWMGCLLYTSPSPRDRTRSRMPSSA